MSGARQYTFKRASELPPLRESPFAPDGHDAARAEYNKYLWCEQDDLLRSRDRQIEENIRMLHGQQWIVWSEMKGRFINLLDTLEDDEKRWRHMPVLNRLLLWFVLLHSRMTENPPVVGWNAGPDRIDAILAEVADPIVKYLWTETQMPEVLDRMFAWLIPCGRSHLKTIVDPYKGDPKPMTAPAMLQLLGADGQPVLGQDMQPIQRLFRDVPYAPNPADPSGDYIPALEMVGEDLDTADVRPKQGLAPEVLYEGGLDVLVLTALEVRGEWGQHIPWHRKQYHIQKSLLTPLQFYEAFGYEMEPDVRGQEAEGTAVLWRLMHSSGMFGATDSRRGEPSSEQEFVTVYESWHRPSRLAGTERTEESPGGRVLITTGGGQTVRDGVRPAALKYTSPIRCFDFVNLPGRPQGTSPQEFLNGPVRTRNRLFAQKLGHATLTANPIRVVDRSTGLQKGDVPNIPGAEVVVDRSKSKNPVVEYVAVPALGGDVDDATDRLTLEIDQLGQVAGSEATPPTDDSSALLVQELRFNSDRPIAATMKRVVTELGRLEEDWIALSAVIWDENKIIKIGGEDNISRVITVYPELLRMGRINAVPEIESMLPESRQERQKRAEVFWEKGVFGIPASPMAIQAFLEHARFPHLSRLMRPGGADRATAEQAVGKLLQGATADDIPVFPWYDHMLFLYVLEQYMKAPEYLKLKPMVQAQFVALWLKLQDAQSEALLLAGDRQLDVETDLARNKLANQVALKPLADAAAPANPEDGGSPPRPSEPATAA